jgi:hypothetical protein
MEVGKLTRVGRSPTGLINRADNRHCFGPSRSEPSSVTLTVVSMPRKELLVPMNVPLSGRTCFGGPGDGDTNQVAVSHYAIGRIKSIHPAPGRLVPRCFWIWTKNRSPHILKLGEMLCAKSEGSS